MRYLAASSVFVFVLASARAASAAAITSPAEGATVATTFTIQVTYGTVTECDTDGCYEADAESVAVSAFDGSDWTTLGSCSATSECAGGQATFEVTLAPGSYTLSASVFAGFSVDSSQQVSVTVMESAADSSSSGTSGGAAPDDEGCGCRGAGVGRGAGGWMILAMAGSLARRRRPAGTRG